MRTNTNADNARPIAYITRDLERALPLNFKKGHFIITNYTAFAKEFAKKNKGVFLINSGQILDTLELISHSDAKKLINKIKPFGVLVFKNTPAIERVCTANNWNLVNPPAALASKIEEKISQVEWLKELSHLLPPHQIVNGSKIVYKSRPYIAQFNRAHTGSGTFLVDSPKAAAEISTKFPNRPVRISKFINGPVFTCNIVIIENSIITGSISYQITGLKPFTSNSFTTVGNDWSLPTKILSKQNLFEFNTLATAVGKKLMSEGWKGLFGIDVIFDIEKNKFYLIEINARQPASTSYESELQSAVGNPTIFDLHLAALLNEPGPKTTTKIEEGAQIILRVPEKETYKNLDKAIKNLEKAGFKIINYENNRAGSDLLRIMSKKGIMLSHNTLNEVGKKIEKIVQLYGK